MRKRGIYWQARPKAGGKLGKWRSTRCTDQKAAQAVLAEWERELADPAYASAKGATISQAGVRLTQDLISLVNVGKRSEATKGYYFEKIGTLARILGPDRLLAEITAPVVDGFIESRRLEEVTEHTIAKELGVLRVLLKTAKRNGWWSGDLDAILPHGFGTGAKPRERFLSSLAELGKVLRAIGNSDIAAQVAFSVATGAEAQAIRRAQWCDLAERFVAIHGKKRPSRERVVPVVASWQETLLLFVRQNSLSDKAGGNPQLFVHIHGIPKALREACKKLGLPHLCPNDLRRTFNVWMDAAGVPVALRAQAMGHASTKLLDKFTYGKLSPDMLRDRMRETFDGKSGGRGVAHPRHHAGGVLLSRGGSRDVVDSGVSDELGEQDRRCPTCQNWLDRYGRCLQCAEDSHALVQPAVQVCQSGVMDAGGQGRTELDNSTPANTDSPLEMAPRAGIEPATYGLTERHSAEGKDD